MERADILAPEIASTLQIVYVEDRDEDFDDIQELLGERGITNIRRATNYHDAGAILRELNTLDKVSGEVKKRVIWIIDGVFPMYSNGDRLAKRGPDLVYSISLRRKEDIRIALSSDPKIFDEVANEVHAIIHKGAKQDVIQKIMTVAMETPKSI